MSLNRKDVRQVSLLARLQLSEAELETMTAQLAQIVRYVEQLGELDTDNVEPMAHGVERFNVFSGDQPRDGLSRQNALVNAPKQDGEYYRVPAVLGE